MDFIQFLLDANTQSEPSFTNFALQHGYFFLKLTAQYYIMNRQFHEIGSIDELIIWVILDEVFNNDNAALRPLYQLLYLSLWSM